MKYVVGFIFSQDLKNVLLIRKKKPAWQAGFLNGIGGKIEMLQDSYVGLAVHENPFQAMARETREETGLDIGPQAWTYFACLQDAGATVHFFFATVERCVLTAAKSLTEEPVGIELVCSVNDLRTIPNLQWLIPLAQHWNTSISGSRYAAPVMILEEAQPLIGHHVFMTRCYGSDICIVCGDDRNGELHV